MDNTYEVHPGLRDAVPHTPAPAEAPVVEQNAIQATEDIPQENHESPEVNTVEHEETAQKKHFKALRDKAYQIEKERDAMAKRIQELERQQQKTSQYTQEYDNPDDLADRGYVNKKLARIEEQLIVNQIKSSCPDFDSVVSAENVAALRREHPDIAAALASSNDLHAQALATYKMIKKYGIYDDEHTQYNQRRLEQNSTRPRSAASLSPQRGDSALSKANDFAAGLTPSLQKSLYKEMKEAQKK